ncbi:hypothetical protein l13_07410 [Neisseria weaveri ATCC 51223]|nr:hypothetical protein l13_07410 [Neisseria weaveri ATCC 51223]
MAAKRFSRRTLKYIAGNKPLYLKGRLKKNVPILTAAG